MQMQSNEACAMKNMAPEIFRQRLLMEGYYAIEGTSDSVVLFLTGIAPL